MKTTRKRQAGFSLLELIIVVSLLLLMLGAIFSQIEKAQTRYRVEDQKLDLTQQERDFIDQFTRDLHQAGFPSPAMYGNRLDLNSSKVSAGVWSVSATDIYMEGDLDDNERVQETQYHYDDGTTPWPGPGPNPCPCIRRSSVPKVEGFFPWDPNQAKPQYYTEVQNLISVANQPLFQIYGADGQPVPMPNGNLVLGSPATGVDQQAAGKLQDIKAIRITITTQGKGVATDPDAHHVIQVTMNGTARLPNN